MPETKYFCQDDILCGVNIPKNQSNLSEIEKKHLPTIEAPGKVKKDEVFKVNVRVGGIDSIEHPNEAGHFIEWVELYSGDTFLARVHYSGGTSFPVAEFKIKLSHSHGQLKVWAKCNLHGLWEGTKDIEIQD